jgi:hypothetical protein
MVCLGGYVGDGAYGKLGWWPVFMPGSFLRTGSWSDHPG